VASLPFVIFAHVQQNDLGIGSQTRARLGDTELVYAFFFVVDKIQKNGCMNPATKLGRAPRRSIKFHAG